MVLAKSRFISRINEKQQKGVVVGYKEQSSAKAVGLTGTAAPFGRSMVVVHVKQRTA